MTSDRTRSVATNVLLDAEVTHVGYEIVIGRFAFVRPWDGKYLGRFIAVRNLDLQLKNANKTNYKAIYQTYKGVFANPFFQFSNLLQTFLQRFLS